MGISELRYFIVTPFRDNDTQSDLLPGLHSFPRLSRATVVDSDWHYTITDMADSSLTFSR
jgi:hypothetical protein